MLLNFHGTVFLSDAHSRLLSAFIFAAFKLDLFLVSATVNTRVCKLLFATASSQTSRAAATMQQAGYLPLLAHKQNSSRCNYLCAVFASAMTTTVDSFGWAITAARFVQRLLLDYHWIFPKRLENIHSEDHKDHDGPLKS